MNLMKKITLDLRGLNLPDGRYMTQVEDTRIKISKYGFIFAVVRLRVLHGKRKGAVTHFKTRGTKDVFSALLYMNELMNTLEEAKVLATVKKGTVSRIDKEAHENRRRLWTFMRQI